LIFVLRKQKRKLRGGSAKHSEIKTDIQAKKTNENEKYFSNKLEILTTNFIFILVQKIQQWLIAFSSYGLRCGLLLPI